MPRTCRTTDTVVCLCECENQCALRLDIPASFNKQILYDFFLYFFLLISTHFIQQQKRTRFDTFVAFENKLNSTSSVVTVVVDGEGFCSIDRVV